MGISSIRQLIYRERLHIYFIGANMVFIHKFISTDDLSLDKRNLFLKKNFLDKGAGSKLSEDEIQKLVSMYSQQDIYTIFEILRRDSDMFRNHEFLDEKKSSELLTFARDALRLQALINYNGYPYSNHYLYHVWAKEHPHIKVPGHDVRNCVLTYKGKEVLLREADEHDNGIEMNLPLLFMFEYLNKYSQDISPERTEAFAIELKKDPITFFRTNHITYDDFMLEYLKVFVKNAAHQSPKKKTSRRKDTTGVSFDMLISLPKTEQNIRKHHKDLIDHELYSPELIRYLYEHNALLKDPLYRYEQGILDIIQASPHKSTLDLQIELDTYFIDKAIHVLNGYKGYDNGGKGNGTITHIEKNLLSRKGMRTLSRLNDLRQRTNDMTAKKEHMTEETYAQFRSMNEIEHISYSAGNKYALDLDLFKDLKINDKGIAYLWHNYQGVTSGCYNQCAHCGLSAGSPVRHLPYPIALKLMKFIFLNGTGIRQAYFDSDPLAYFDRTINADYGDFARRCYEELGIKFHQTTKGVLQNYTKIALRKLAEFNTDIRLSVVVLNGEGKKKSMKNLERIDQTLHILKRTLSSKDFNAIAFQQVSDDFLKNDVQVNNYFRTLLTKYDLKYSGPSRDLSEDRTVGLFPLGRAKELGISKSPDTPLKMQSLFKTWLNATREFNIGINAEGDIIMYHFSGKEFDQFKIGSIY